MRKVLITAVLLGLLLVFSSQGLTWYPDAPEIKHLSSRLQVNDYDGKEEFTIWFVYMNDTSLDYIFPENKETVREATDNKRCFLVNVLVEQDSYFYPTNIEFVQGRTQYAVGYDDVVRISESFSGKLRAGVSAGSFVLLPEDIDVYSRFTIYYDDDSILFSVPETEKEQPSTDKQIELLEEEQASLTVTLLALREQINSIEKRIKEIAEELEELR